MDYAVVDLKNAYTLQNAGGLVLVCTKDGQARYDLAPVAWCCPMDYEPVSRFLCVLDTSHKTYEDLAASREFAIALPRASQRELVMKCGSVSGLDVDKYEKFGISSFSAHSVDVRIPSGVAGWIECSLFDIVVKGTSAIVMGEALHVEAMESAWEERLHFVEEGLAFSPGRRI